jgi:hypothetical protein
MCRFASALAAVTLAVTLTVSSPTPANASVISTGIGILSGVGGTILGVGKTLVCKGLSAAGTVAEGAGTVGGAAVGGADTGGAGAGAGAAAGGAVGGIVKKGAGLVEKVICSGGGGGGVAGTLGKAAVGALAGAAVFDLAAHWMIGAATKVTGAIVSMITSSTSPQLNAAWFQRSFAPMAGLGAALALLVTLIALTSAAVRRDPAALAGTLTGILRAGLGTALLIALTTLALDVTDAISADVIRSSHQTFWSQVGHAWGSSGFGGFGSSALAMLMAIVQVIAGVIVWLELAVRNAAICLAVLFLPVALAASIWPNLAGWTSRLGRLLFLFVILKPVTLIVLAFAGNAALAGLSLNGSLASSAGTIIAAVTIFALAAMAPWALMLIVAADSESAAIGAGVRAAAGHARSDGAATLGRAGGRLRGGTAAAGGALGAAGGAIRGAAAGRRGRGSSGSGPSGGGGSGGGGGGGPAGPAGGSSGSSGGGSAADVGGGSPSPARGGRSAPAGGLAGAMAGSAPRGAVAVAAGLAGGAAGGGQRRGGGEPAPGPPSGSTGGAIRAPGRRPSRTTARPKASTAKAPPTGGEAKPSRSAARTPPRAPAPPSPGAPHRARPPKPRPV